jgi:hypothetical protein
MALGWKRTPPKDDPRLEGHQTTYQASRGGWHRPVEKPIPANPKK